MYARVACVTIDPDQYDAARRALEAEILPRVREQLSGASAGYWLEPVDGKGLTVVIFDTKEAAEAPVPNAQPGDSPAPGVTVERVEIREVIGSL